jgi:phosphoribosylamine--glycine ligase
MKEQGGVGLRVLVVGGGGREHAIAWKLAQSALVDALYCAPGNSGTATVATNLSIPATDVAAMVAAAKELAIDLVMIGPEKPLALGLADILRAEGFLVCGHQAEAAMIETSKTFAKAIMATAGIPTAHSVLVSDFDTAIVALDQFTIPVVIKADGLADGKGVVVASSREEAEAAIRAFLVDATLGAAGSSLLIEEFLAGPEMSAIAFVDGETVVPLAPSCDHKPVFDGNLGPNTGGMGTYAPAPQISPELFEQIVATVLKPAAQAMFNRGTPLQGILYAGVVLTESGPKIIEYNARFGDPETQVLLPMMAGDLGQAIYAVATGTLAQLPPIEQNPGSAVCVVLASGGYPGPYETGLPISGADEPRDGVIVFHAGAKRLDDGTLVTNGGRVLNVVGLGSNIEEARQRAYGAIAGISFEGMHARSDIGSYGLD